MRHSIPRQTRTAAFIAAVALSGCGSDPSSTSRPLPAGGSAERRASDNDWFVDRAEGAGLNFVYDNGMSGHFYFPEMLGGGVAVFDYDNDGDLDIYFAQGRALGSGETIGQTPAQSVSQFGGRLFRNDLAIQADGTRALRFTDVTEPSGIRANDYGMGVAIGDFNNDGCADLYLTNFAPNRLYRNNCNGTFTDVSESSRVDDPEWSVSASFVDYDRDGWLDLYVGNYVQYSLAIDQACTGLSGRRDYCTPAVYTARTDRLYHNQRNGTFADVTGKALVGGPFGPALGVSAADFNGDGWPDVYVANDGKQNLLWVNQHDGTFRNTGLLSGVALSADGKPQGSMGVDAADFDNDGDEDLFMTQLPNEGSSFYVNDGSGFFEDRSRTSRLGPLSTGFTGFGTAWLDFDNDGWLDLFAANGSIEAQKARLNDQFPYDERFLLFRNLGDGRFENVSDGAGAAFRSLQIGRGVAAGDLDNDGDVDLVINNVHRPASLLMNNAGNRHHWLGLRLTRDRRAVVGARVQVVRSSGRSLWRRTRADGSYASANDPRVVVGLGESTEAPTVRVQWPDGAAEEWKDVTIDRWTTLQQGESRKQ